MFTAGIITTSDEIYAGIKLDESGMIIKDILTENEYDVVKSIILPHDEESLINEMKYMSDELGIDIIITTGGIGFGETDVTPEATFKVVQKLALGINEAIRYNSFKITKRAILSRGISGIRNNKTIIVNLPGSPKAVKEGLDYIVGSLKHGIEILKGIGSDCAAKQML